MNARTDVLNRIRRALADVPDGERPEDVPVPRHYSRGGTPPAGSPEAVDLLTRRLADYGASVRLVTDDAVAAAVAEAVAARRADSVVMPHGFPRQWQAELAHERVLSDHPRVP